MEQNNTIIIQGGTEKQKGIHYEIDPSREPIGKGGTGVVRIGQRVDEKTGVRRDVAIKFLYDDMPANMLVRSQREASIRILSENLVEMIDFVQITECDVQGRSVVHSHVVSELLHGVMLLDILKGKTTDKDGNEVQAAREYLNLMQTDRNQFAIKIVRNVLSGIQALHDNGYIHRDIDPSNIMITDRGKVKLIDLGIAKKIDTMQQSDEQHLTSTGQFIGKAAYAAPELVLGDLANQNETTDIYAIGIMLYLLVVGKLPFNGPLQEILHQQCNEKMPLQDVKDKNIRKVIKTATEKRQAERYQTASEFRVAVDAISRRFKPVTHAPSMPKPSPMASPIHPSATPAATVVSSIPEAGTVVDAPADSGTAIGSAYIPQPQQHKKNPGTLLYIVAAISAILLVCAGIYFVAGSSSSDGGGGTEMPQLQQAETTTLTDASIPSTDIQDTQSDASMPSAKTIPQETSDAPAPVSVPDPVTHKQDMAEKAPVTTTTAKTTATTPKAEKTTKPETRASKPATTAAKGMKLSYGTYTGSVKNGYPNGKGKLVYTTSRRINKYDSKGFVAQPGEYVEGLFVNGFLTVGKHYSANGELLNKISAGVAEGVYEAK